MPKSTTAANTNQNPKVSVRSMLGTKGAQKTNAIREIEMAMQQIASTYDIDPPFDPVTGAYNLRSAVAREDYHLRAKAAEKFAAGSDWSVCIMAFEKAKRNRLEPRTLEGYLTHFKTFLRWLKETDLEEKFPPREMNSDVIEEYLSYILEQGNSRVTANSKLTALKIFFKFLKQREIIDHDPTSTIPKFKTDTKPVYSFTPEQVAKIFSVIPINTWRGARDYCLLRFIVETGCRVDEALNVKISHLTFDNRGIPTHVVFPKTKNHESREVAIPPKLAQAIMYWLQKREAFKVTPDTADFLHINPELTPVHIRNLQKYFLDYCKTAGVDGKGVRCSPYTLKHTFCKLFLLGGGSVNALQEIVGHKDARMLQKYTRMMPKERHTAHIAFAPSKIFDF